MTLAQRGLSLVIVMIFLSAITAVSIWSVRQSMFGEGMARNQMDVEVARQAAEAALRDAERDLMNLTPTVLPNASCTRGLDRPPRAFDFDENCTNGFCAMNDTVYANADYMSATSTTANAEPWWPPDKGGLWNNDLTTKPGRSPITATNCGTFTGGVPLGTFTGAAVLPGVAMQPEYLIEYFQRRSTESMQVTNYYRITARGFGYTPRTQIVLQTIYAPLQEP